MALGDPYLDLDTFKLRHGIVGEEQDAQISQTLIAVSRQIDQWCGRTFNKDASATIRYFTPVDTSRSAFSYSGYAGYGSYVVEPGDFVSLTAVETDSSGLYSFDSTWTVSDYILLPRNAPITDEPYTRIERHPGGSYDFFPHRDSVKLTGVFGWPEVPSVIVEVTAIQAHRIFKRASAPFGIVGSVELGQMRSITSIDPDMKAMLAGFRVKTV